jgi:hypothetical protein
MAEAACNGIAQKLRVVLHFLKSILKYDAALSILGTSLSWYDPSSIGNISAAPLVSGLLIRFSIIFCSAGYAVSVLTYLAFKRDEIPIYLNNGLYFRQVVLASWALLVMVLVLANILFSILVGPFG